MTKQITAEELDQLVDDGQDITEHIDMTTIVHPAQGEEIRRVNVDYPEWVIKNLDIQADRIGITRQALIKLWPVERLEEEALKQRELMQA